VRQVRRIVVGVDGSDAALTAARWALHEAHRCGATLTVVHAWRTYVASPSLSPLQSRHVAAYVDAAQQTLDTVMKRLRAEPEAPQVDLDPVLIPGTPGPVLVDESTDADMLVVGSHGRGDVGRVVLGSVSAYCVHHAACSTLIVPSRPLAEHRRERLALVSAGSDPDGRSQRRRERPDASKPRTGRDALALRSAARQGEARHRTGGGHGIAVGPNSDSVT
jgi:nucleotide-binding universal stress UspA family protein